MIQHQADRDTPELITGGVHTDGRGQLKFVNDFTFQDVKRFYCITHPNTEIVRAWQGHRIEKKAFYVLSGSFLICTVEIDNWSTPSPDLPVLEFKLTGTESQVLVLPAGYANGFRALDNDSQIMVFSSLDIDESQQDDYRFPQENWYTWN